MAGNPFGRQETNPTEARDFDYMLDKVYNARLIPTLHSHERWAWTCQLHACMHSMVHVLRWSLASAKHADIYIACQYTTVRIRTDE